MYFELLFYANFKKKPNFLPEYDNLIENLAK